MTQSHPRRILLAATGLFPQIVTETLYALAVQPGAAGQAFLPTEIHLITTAEGARLARTALLHPDGGQFHALLANYPQLGHPVFDDAHIHQIHNAQGQPLLLADEIGAQGRNLSFEREFGKIIARLDLLAAFTTEKYRRAAISYVQGIVGGTFLQFLPVR